MGIRLLGNRVGACMVRCGQLLDIYDKIDHMHDVVDDPFKFSTRLVQDLAELISLWIHTSSPSGHCSYSLLHVQ